MKKVFCLSVFFSVIFSITVVAEDLDKETLEEVNIQALPTATMSTPDFYNSGRSFRPVVRTSSHFGPHTFFFDAGDGRRIMRGDTILDSTYTFNAISYTALSSSQSFTQRARVADQLNASPWVSKNVTVYPY
ncbi:hypothetical protein ACERII_23260 [Evansella sp. AB-rgal1]|uniref:hypothetical protein n=1 Tax=Evansella sp. AB-rgal1 TaxID=3242696 RepID=UPI00359E8E72